MNSIKNTIVTVTLLAVGYGTYVVLSEPAPTGVAQRPIGEIWDTTGPGIVAEPGPLVNVPEPGASGELAIPPSDESFPTSGSRSESGVDSTLDIELAPDPSVASAATGGPHSDDAPTGLPLSPPETAPLPGPLPSPTSPQDGTAGATAPAAAGRPGQGYYDRRSEDAGESAYPETSTPQFPTDEPPPSSDGHPGFEETWKAVQTNLQNGQLAEALFALTVWYEEPTLSEEQSLRCIQLLDQLAGTVIYSRESFLESAHIVREGETLGSLAEQYGVPAELIARINGIVPPSRLDPGESLKVLRGPFRAEISRSRSEVTVFLGRYYAGRFPVRLGPELPPSDNKYEVIAKENGREYFDRRTFERITREDARNPYGDRWIGLRGEQITAAHNVGIHVDVNESELCCIAVSSVDADDLSAILSIGSQVVVKP